MIPRPLMRVLLSAIVFGNGKAKRLAIRLTKWTGKSPECVHPKHLLADAEDQYWYLAHVGPEHRVLDVGCGNGMHTIKVARRCALAAGVDRNAELLGVGARSCVGQNATNVRLVRGDVEEGLPFAAASFDRVLCNDVLEHLWERDRVLGEIRRVLKAGGLLLLAVPNRETSWKRRLHRAGLFAFSDPDHKIEYTLPELEEELGRNGFRIVQLHSTVYDTPLIGAIDLVGGLSLAMYGKLTEARRRLARKYPEENVGFYAVCTSR